MATEILCAVENMNETILTVAMHGIQGQQTRFINIVETIPEEHKLYVFKEGVFWYITVNWHRFPNPDQVVEFFGHVLNHRSCPVDNMKDMLASGLNSCSCKSLLLYSAITPYEPPHFSLLGFDLFSNMEISIQPPTAYILQLPEYPDVTDDNEDNPQPLTKLDLHKNFNAFAARFCGKRIIDEDGFFVLNMVIALEHSDKWPRHEYASLVLVVTEWLNLYHYIIRDRIVLNRTTRRSYTCGPLYAACVGGNREAPLDMARWNWWYNRFIELGGSANSMEKFN